MTGEVFRYKIEASRDEKRFSELTQTNSSEIVKKQVMIIESLGFNARVKDMKNKNIIYKKGEPKNENQT